MFILIHQVVREGKDKVNRKIIFENQQHALDYLRDLREHETIILLKQYYSRVDKDRRSEERITKDRRYL